MLRFGGSWVFRLQLEQQRTGGQVSGAENLPEHKSQALIRIENIKLPSHAALGVLKLLQRQRKIAFPLPSDRLHVCGAHKHIIIHTFIEVLYKNQVLYPVI